MTTATLEREHTGEHPIVAAAAPAEPATHDTVTLAAAGAVTGVDDSWLDERWAELTGLAARRADVLRRGLAPREAVGSRLPAGLRLGLFVFALAAIALGATLMIAAGIGVGPGDAIISAVARHTGQPHGTAALLFSGTMLALAFATRSGPGVGTIALAVGVGPAMNFLAAGAPHPHTAAAQLAQLTIGAGVCAFGVAAAIQAAYGPGSLELLTRKLSAITGRSDASIRIGIEISFAAVAVIAGGAAGPATLAIAATFGPAVAYGVAALGRILAPFCAPTPYPPLIPRFTRLGRL